MNIRFWIKNKNGQNTDSLGFTIFSFKMEKIHALSKNEHESVGYGPLQYILYVPPRFYKDYDLKSS